MYHPFAVVCALMVVMSMQVGRAADNSLAWPAITREHRPWAYNWWMGSAVDRENLSRELKRYHEGGLGGIHIIPIYGAKAAESRYIPYLSPQWMEMFRFAVGEAGRLDMGVDLTTGTGWCFGGPNVPAAQGCLQVSAKDFDATGKLIGGRTVTPVKRPAPGGEGPMLNPFYAEAMRSYLDRFSAAFPLDGGVRPRSMYHDSFEYGGNWSPDLLAQFEKRRGYRLQEHVRELFTGSGEQAARIKSDYRETICDLIIEDVFPQWIDWSRQRKMLTRNQAHGSPGNLLDLYALADIPETEMFGRGTRDPLVSRFDERFLEGDREPLVSKFASSAAHVAGRKLVSAETGTWLAEHFCETLEELKCLVDLLFASGVNHIIYHGCIYSPDDAAWPGWLFYATTQLNPRNSIWHDAPVLNQYIARCQSILQSGRPDNDLLVYWPIHDLWHNDRGDMMRLTVHGRDWLVKQPIGATARLLWERGYAFDYISDRQLAGASASGQGIAVPGGTYRAVLVPPTQRMPIPTLRKLVALAEGGATVIFQDMLPEDVPGLKDLDGRREELRAILGRIGAGGKIGKGRILIGGLEAMLATAAIPREPLADHAGARFIRRAHETGRHYFVANQSTKAIDGWVQLGTAAASVAILDPMTGQAGIARTSPGEGGRPRVLLHVEPGHSILLRTFDRETTGPAWPYELAGERRVAVVGPWRVQFIQGGPVLPKTYELAALASWTKNGDSETERFAGTAIYSTTFDAPPGGGSFILDLGTVCHSARVRLNGREVGRLIMSPYRLRIAGLKPAGNVLEVEVTNLSANRIRDLDRRKIEWRIFRDINLVNIGYKGFDASNWPVMDSGLLGPVTLVELKARAK